MYTASREAASEKLTQDVDISDLNESTETLQKLTEKDTRIVKHRHVTGVRGERRMMLDYNQHIEILYRAIILTILTTTLFSCSDL